MERGEGKRKETQEAPTPSPSPPRGGGRRHEPQESQEQPPPPPLPSMDRDRQKQDETQETLPPSCAKAWRCSPPMAQGRLKQKKTQQSRFPDELMMEILAWLPATSILNFRSVCQSWNGSTRKDSFLNLHRSRAAGRKLWPTYICSTANVLGLLHGQGMFFLNDDGGGPDQSEPVKKVPIRIPGLEDHEITFGDSCHGLTLYFAEDKSAGSFLFSNMFVTNLLTGQLLQAPGYQAGEVFLGFDLVDKQHKLVALVHPQSEPEFVRVYTLGGGGDWRHRGPTPFPAGSLRQSRPAYCSGALHWLVRDAADAFHIYSFDVGQKVFHYRPFPHALDRGDDDARLLAWWGDVLCLEIKNKVQQSVKLWEARNCQENNAWSLKRTITFPLGDTHVSFAAYKWAVGPWGDGDHELLMRIKRGFVALNLRSGDMRKVRVAKRGMHGAFKLPELMLPYVGTLDCLT